MSQLLEEVTSFTSAAKVPYHVLLELTYGCNLRCVMCYNPTHEARDELSLEDYEALFDQLVELGTLQLTLTGGEVLARPDFWEIAAAARRRHFALRIFTNGTRVTPEVAERFAALAPVAIEVSLYGGSAPSHDAVTARPGSFERTVEGIRNLRAAGAPVVVKTLLTQLNRHEIVETLELIEDLGVHFKGFDPVVFETHSGDSLPLQLKVPAAEVAQLLPVDLTYREEIHCDDDATMCGAGHDFVSITPHGLVYPCLSMRIPMGNVRTRPFGDIWTAPNAEIDLVRATTWADLPVCSGCEAKAGCQRCPGLAYHEDGDLLGPSTTHCDLSYARHPDVERPAETYSRNAAATAVPVALGRRPSA